MTKTQKVARAAASYKANRAADALRAIDRAYAEAESSGTTVDMSGATVRLRETLEREAAAAGFPASEFYQED